MSKSIKTISFGDLREQEKNVARAKWRQKVVRFCPEIVRRVEMGGGRTGILRCRVLPDPPPAGSGFVRNKGGDGDPGRSNFQVKVTVSKGRVVRAGSLVFPFRVEYGEEEGTASHLCHNPLCHNPCHLVFEPLSLNKARAGCPGPNGGCLHNPVCLMAGPDHRNAVPGRSLVNIFDGFRQ